MLYCVGVQNEVCTTVRGAECSVQCSVGVKNVVQCAVQRGGEKCSVVCSTVWE